MTGKTAVFTHASWESTVLQRSPNDAFPKIQLGMSVHPDFSEDINAWSCLERCLRFSHPVLTTTTMSPPSNEFDIIFAGGKLTTSILACYCCSPHDWFRRNVGMPHCRQTHRGGTISEDPHHRERPTNARRPRPRPTCSFRHPPAAQQSHREVSDREAV